MPLTPPLTVCTSIPVPTESSSKWFTPTPILYWCVTCSSLTMPPLQRIPRQHCRGSSTNSPVRVALWPYNQSQENQCDYPVCQPYPWNQNRRPHSRGSRQIHLPRFHYLHELELWLRDLSKNRQSHRRHVQFDQESVGKQIPDWKHQNAHLQSIRSPHIALRQWNLDHLHETETPLELFQICDASGASFASSGKTSSLTMRYCHVLEPPACTPYTVNAAWDGSGIVHRMDNGRISQEVL